MLSNVAGVISETLLCSWEDPRQGGWVVFVGWRESTSGVDMWQHHLGDIAVQFAAFEARRVGGVWEMDGHVLCSECCRVGRKSDDSNSTYFD